MVGIGPGAGGDNTEGDCGRENRATAIGNERERDAGHRSKTNVHTKIDKDLEK